MPGPLKILVIGLTLSGKDELCRVIAQYLGVTTEARPRHGAERDREPHCYSIQHHKLWNTPGLGDLQRLDDRTVRILMQQDGFNAFDLVLYCWRPTGNNNQSGVRYCKLFGDNTPVTLVINHYPADDQKAEVEREARTQVESEGLVVRDVFYLPPPALITTTNDLARLWNRVLQFNNNVQGGVRFTPAPLSAVARQIITLKRQLAADHDRVKPQEVQVFSSEGMACDTSRESIYTAPSGRTVPLNGCRIHETSVNDGDNNGYCRMTRMSDNTIRVEARMPKKRGGFLGGFEERQWRDARFYVTHVGTLDPTIPVQLETLRTANHEALIREIGTNWSYYSSRCG